MPTSPDVFRDFGIIPDTVEPPPPCVRASFGAFRVFGQYLGTAIAGSFGLGFAVLAALVTPFPWGLLAAPVFLGGTAAFVYFVTRNDYAWIELDGTTLRAQHLYTRRIVERPLEDVHELQTLVLLVRTPAVLVTEAWLGRVRGVMIRFRDQRTPLLVSRRDPKMHHAKELIEAIVYRMWERGNVDAEVVNLDGQPIIARIFWTTPAPGAGSQR